jgi:hypothetical protein
MSAYVSLAAMKDRLEIDATDTADDRKLRRAVEAATRAVDAMTGQRFQPYSGTRYMATPYSDVTYLRDGLITLTSLATLTSSIGGTRVYGDTWASTDYDLTPEDAAMLQEPYSAIRANPDGRYRFPINRAAVQVAGLWGWWLETETAAALNGGINSSVTSVTVASPHTVEALNTILVGTEQMYVTATTATTLSVRRGVNGTAAAAHLTGAEVSVYVYPDDVSEATALQASRLFRRHEAPFGIAGSPEVGQTAVIARVDPDVRLMLRDYRRMAVGAT